MDATRRSVLLGSLGLSAWIHAQEMARAAEPRFDTLDPAMAADIDALVSHIIPSADGPGAREAGVIFFIDRALGTFDSDKVAVYRTGMAQLQQVRGRMFPTSVSVAALTPEQQIELLRAIETTEFFELLRTHTVLGFLGPPSYGGNRGQVGWKHIGFEHRMAWQPPFGWYDGEGA